MMQCQREAARFASTVERVDEIRRLAIRTAMDHINAGEPAAALQAMHDGQKAQCPLTFNPAPLEPWVRRVAS